MTSNRTPQPRIRIDGEPCEETALPHVWSERVGAGRANEALRADWQRQFTEAVDSLGFKYLGGLLPGDALPSGQGSEQEDPALDRRARAWHRLPRRDHRLGARERRRGLVRTGKPDQSVQGREPVPEYRRGCAPPVHADRPRVRRARPRRRPRAVGRDVLVAVGLTVAEADGTSRDGDPVTGGAGFAGRATVARRASGCRCGPAGRSRCRSG